MAGIARACYWFPGVSSRRTSYHPMGSLLSISWALLCRARATPCSACAVPWRVAVPAITHTPVLTAPGEPAHVPAALRRRAPLPICINMLRIFINRVVWSGKGILMALYTGQAWGERERMTSGQSSLTVRWLVWNKKSKQAWLDRISLLSYAPCQGSV